MNLTLFSLINDLIDQNEDFAASPTGGAPKLDLLTQVRRLFRPLFVAHARRNAISSSTRSSTRSTISLTASASFVSTSTTTSPSASRATRSNPPTSGGQIGRAHV